MSWSCFFCFLFFLPPAKHHNRAETKKNFEETFWFRLKRCVFCFPCFFVLIQKKTGVCLVFQGPWLEAITKKTKKTCVFFEVKTKKKGKTKKTSVESKPKSLLKVLFVCLVIFVCLHFFQLFNLDQIPAWQICHIVVLLRD